ncbi:four helix bundle protein [Chryseobacterium sp. 2TAF14]|uniref:four helix bundle protein n=1 Tax=Chryseobacterium sp. 2TAF14 TaxID=3233007 RepID=UPI003F8FE416
MYKVLYHERNEKTLSKQLLRSGTSIGANIEEGIASFSKKEFIYKLQISYKEAYESFFGLSFYIKQSSLMIQNLIL